GAERPVRQGLDDGMAGGCGCVHVAILVGLGANGRGGAPTAIHACGPARRAPAAPGTYIPQRCMPAMAARRGFRRPDPPPSSLSPPGETPCRAPPPPLPPATAVA